LQLHCKSKCEYTVYMYSNIALTHPPHFATQPSSWPALDRCLGGGWHDGEWHELLGAGFGVGEFSVLLPLLAQATARKARVALIHPPYQPYAPALCAAGIGLNDVIVIEPKTSQAACWAAEHCLRALHGGVVVVWTQETQLLGDVTLRRLRKAAQVGRSVGIALRPARAEQCPSPAGVRLRYESTEAGIALTCVKRRYNAYDTVRKEITAHIALAALSAQQAPSERTPLFLHSPLPSQPQWQWQLQPQQ
jgi:cell division inhibitor SulA